ncbi:unnamed protein product, partial [marine sediment metagenome]
MLERIFELRDKIGIKGFSALSAIIGAPLGLFPILYDFYGSGVGAKARMDTAKAFEIFRFDPDTITRLWLRGFPDEERKEDWWEDLKDAGWNDDRIGAAKELAHFLPSPAQAIAFLAHEVFEPAMIEKYKLDDEFEGLDLTIPRKIGMTDEMSL